jgi:cyclophilin family peptidyl-prolyl cis-trans isomerase
MKKLILFILFFTFGFIANSQNTKVKIVTTIGIIVVELYNETPKHRANFLQLIKNKTLDSTLFHRVIQNFMIQAGDITSKRANADSTLGEGDLPYMVDAEFMPEKYFHKKGALAAARDTNAKKASSACQFYIVQGKILTPEARKKLEGKGRKFTEQQLQTYTTIGGTPHLDGEYTVFGQVISGLDVVDKIASVATNKDKGDRPIVDVRIISIRKMRKKFLGIF